MLYESIYIPKNKPDKGIFNREYVLTKLSDIINAS